MTHISSLIVFDRLTVDRITVEPKRVKARYVLKINDQKEVMNELIYSYDQVFFDQKSIADQNLASMMAIQVALNYGLFCKEIYFDGTFDQADRRFIMDMIENTSREIFVNKFLFRNEFLRPPFDQIEARIYDRYTASEVKFIQPLSGKIGTDEDDKTKLNDFVILSSGGKDSLLTYGIVKEIGTAHPVFINESGRHWFTAINSYKYYKEHEPNTVKPWCNSDRIFNWMVRQMPFIKENHQNIRADIYPIRLWTVAVFLFGTLPVVRNRRIGNILIGNEYDCTLKTQYKGITHYNALYDQSKYFDNRLTRYYEAKGWAVKQYSVLRSLSELLILKTLVKRYPDLQRLQVSCHAAHEDNGTMKPCGKCEKCRRIIGMLCALDEDPKRCGYSQDQIRNGLNALQEKSVKQIGSDAAQLYHLLLTKGLIQNTDHTRRLAKEHREITKLRFDQERSRLDDLPDYIISDLFTILSQYADGTVQRIQHRQVDIDLNTFIKEHLNKTIT